MSTEYQQFSLAVMHCSNYHFLAMTMPQNTQTKAKNGSKDPAADGVSFDGIGTEGIAEGAIEGKSKITLELQGESLRCKAIHRHHHHKTTGLSCPCCSQPQTVSSLSDRLERHKRNLYVLTTSHRCEHKPQSVFFQRWRCCCLLSRNRSWWKT